MDRLLEPVPDRERLLAGAAAPAAGVLDAAGEAEGSFAALHGLYRAVLNLAEERPVLLAVDDLQWSDRPTLRFVAYLARRLEDAPVLVAATLRSGEPGTDPALIAEIAGDPLCEAVRPSPLGAPPSRRSPRPCSSRPRPSRSTSRARTANSTSAPAATSRAR